MNGNYSADPDTLLLSALVRESRAYPLNWNPLSLHRERRGSPFPGDVVLCETQSQVVWNTPCHLIRYMIRYYSPIMLMNGSMTKTCQPNKHVRMSISGPGTSDEIEIKISTRVLHDLSSSPLSKLSVTSLSLIFCVFDISFSFIYSYRSVIENLL